MTSCHNKPKRATLAHAPKDASKKSQLDDINDSIARELDALTDALADAAHTDRTGPHADLDALLRKAQDEAHGVAGSAAKAAEQGVDRATRDVKDTHAKLAPKSQSCCAQLRMRSQSLMLPTRSMSHNTTWCHNKKSSRRRWRRIPKTKPRRCSSKTSLTRSTIHWTTSEMLCLVWRSPTLTKAFQFLVQYYFTPHPNTELL